jgi:hypothetical protein
LKESHMKLRTLNALIAVKRPIATMRLSANLDIGTWEMAVLLSSLGAKIAGKRCRKQSCVSWLRAKDEGLRLVCPPSL